MTDTADSEATDRAARHQVPSLGLTGERGERLYQAWKAVDEADTEEERQRLAKEAFAV